MDNFNSMTKSVAGLLMTMSLLNCGTDSTLIEAEESLADETQVELVRTISKTCEADEISFSGEPHDLNLSKPQNVSTGLYEDRDGKVLYYCGTNLQEAQCPTDSSSIIFDWKENGNLIIECYAPTRNPNGSIEGDCNENMLTVFGEKEDLHLFRNQSGELTIETHREGEILYHCGNQEQFIQCPPLTQSINVDWTRSGKFFVECNELENTEN